MGAKVAFRQRTRLIQLVKENYSILTHRSNSGRFLQKKIAKWEEFAEILNGLGMSKTPKQWQRAWIDIRKHVRKKIRMKIRKPSDDLFFSEDDRLVARICGLFELEERNLLVHTPSDTNLKEEQECPQSETFSELELVDEESMQSDTHDLHSRSSETSSKRGSERSFSVSPPTKRNRTFSTDQLEDPIAVHSNPNRQPQSVGQSDDIDDECVARSRITGKPKNQQLVEKTEKNEVSSNAPRVNRSTRNETSQPPPNKSKYPSMGMPGHSNIDLQRQMVQLQRRQLAVSRQILERQRSHDADQRQSNARITNLLEAILSQLKSNQEQQYSFVEGTEMVIHEPESD